MRLVFKRKKEGVPAGFRSDALGSRVLVPFCRSRSWGSCRSRLLRVLRLHPFSATIVRVGFCQPLGTPGAHVCSGLQSPQGFARQLGLAFETHLNYGPLAALTSPAPPSLRGSWACELAPAWNPSRHRDLPRRIKSNLCPLKPGTFPVDTDEKIAGHPVSPSSGDTGIRQPPGRVIPTAASGLSRMRATPASSLNVVIAAWPCRTRPHPHPPPCIEENPLDVPSWPTPHTCAHVPAHPPGRVSHSLGAGIVRDNAARGFF